MFKLRIASDLDYFWKTIPVSNGLFQANISGSIKKVSVPYSLKTTKGGKRMKGQMTPEKILKGDVGDRGKIRYSLTNKRYMGHILVAKAFPEICGEWYEGCQVHHKDQCPSNNCAFNLMVVSPEEHKEIHRKLGKNKGEKNFWFGKHLSDSVKSALSKRHSVAISQYTINNEWVKDWSSAVECEKNTGISRSAISNCLKGKSKTAGGFVWKYA